MRTRFGKRKLINIACRLLETDFVQHSQPIAVVKVVSGFDTNKASGSFSIAFSNEPRLHEALNKRSFACRLNCKDGYLR